MNERRTTVYENLQTGILSADLFFYGDDKPTMVHTMPTAIIEHAIGEIPFVDARAADEAELIVSQLPTPKKPSLEVIKMVFSNPFAEIVELTKSPKPTHHDLFSHR